MIAVTPAPPYVAVVFSAVTTTDDAGYMETLHNLRELAHGQPGFLGIESAGGGPGQLELTVSYWRSDDDARAWRSVAEHAAAQRLGRERWYAEYRVRVARVDRDYGSGTTAAE